MNAEVVEKMLLIVRWHQMREYCFSQNRCCVDCPYDLMKDCDVSSTEEVIESCAKVFRDWLFCEEDGEQVSCGDIG